MPQPLRIGIVVASTRKGRFADRPANWFLDRAKKRDGMACELVDLRDYPMPFFDEEKSPLREPPKNEVARKWAKKIAELDGFVFVTSEYNHSIPASLKNALDYAYAEWNKKPAAFVAYGSAGGARAVEQLRLMLVELQVAPLRAAVHVMRTEFMGLLLQGKSFDDYPHFAQEAEIVLDQLAWWGNALRAARAT